MQNELAANGLRLLKIRSIIKPEKHPFDIERTQWEQTVFEHIQCPSFVVAYLDYTVLIGRCKNGAFLFYNHERIDPRYLQRLRVFNPDEELLFWRSGEQLKARLRRDEREEKDEQYVVDARQVLFGTRAEALEHPDFTALVEDRGTRIILPFKGLRVDDNNMLKERIFMKTRNYITYNDLGQAGYDDCRFVGFTDGQRDLE